MPYQDRDRTTVLRQMQTKMNTSKTFDLANRLAPSLHRLPVFAVDL